MGRAADQTEAGALSHISGLDSLDPSNFQEAAWIEVIQKMDEVYSDLIRYEVDLEEKNQELEDAQAFIHSVLTSMSDMLIVCDRDTHIQEVNRATEQLTGFRAEELIGVTFRELLVEGCGALVDGLVDRLREDVSQLSDYEVRLRTKEGGVTDVIALNCSTRFDNTGHPAGMVVIGREIGELRRAYQALNKAHAELQRAQAQMVQQEKMASLGRLVAGVAHELNNPISFVSGNVHTLDKYRERLVVYLDAVHSGMSKLELEELRQKLRIDFLLEDLGPLIEGTLEGSDRVTELVKNLRRLSFAPTGDMDEFDLAKVVTTAVNWASKADKTKTASRAEVKLALPGELVLEGHEGQLHQVFVNLVSNALDAIRDEEVPRIDVVASETAEEVRVVFTDNGPGIPEKDLIKVFDPFFTTKTVGEGTGLGLWLTYGFIRDHGGTMEAGNTPGGGAMFTMTLPKRQPQPSEASAPQGS
ncbi:MAG: sensor histidine kinase [Magnetovibrionaceae bacterium]